MHRVAQIPLNAVNGGRLFADRYEMISWIGPIRARRVAEVGVAFGQFSRYLIDRYKPEEFHAIDLFQLHEVEYLWGSKSEDVFKGTTHKDYYAAALAEARTNVVLKEGFSFDVLAQYPEKYFDVIYVDGSHHYEDVKKDADQSARLLADGGVLVFNDYIEWCHQGNEPFGVVQAVNELIACGGWRVVGFGLHPEMYCDIALERR